MGMPHISNTWKSFVLPAPSEAHRVPERVKRARDASRGGNKGVSCILQLRLQLWLQLFASASTATLFRNMPKASETVHLLSESNPLGSDQSKLRAFPQVASVLLWAGFLTAVDKSFVLAQNGNIGKNDLDRFILY